MKTQEQQRLLVLNRLLCADLTMQEAATPLALSTRQVRRILAAYRKEGAAALVHGNRGRQPVHTIKPEVRQRLCSLARTTYAPCNPQHLRNLVEEREGIRPIAAQSPQAKGRVERLFRTLQERLVVRASG